MNLLSSRTLLTFCVVTAVSVLPSFGDGIGSQARAEHLSATGRVSHHANTDGGVSLAIGLTAPDAAATERTSQDVVVFVDTSASQVGEHREHAADVLRNTLQSLSPTMRVAVFAVDVQVAPLSEGFANPSPSVIDTILARLDRRAPLGATNLPLALRSAMKSLDAERTGAIVYIGDGMSAAELILSDELSLLTEQLRDRQIPVHAYAVGPKTDLQLLGILALRTGGTVARDESVLAKGKVSLTDPQLAGRRLARALAVPVFYPNRIEANGLELLPATALPLRSDRATYYLSATDKAAPVRVSATGTVANGPVTLNWNLAPGSGLPADASLNALVDSVRESEGLTNHLAGDSLLVLAQNDFHLQADQMAAVGERAIAQKRWDDARNVANALQEFDPENGRAGRILKAANKELAMVQPGDIREDRFVDDNFAPPALTIPPRQAAPDFAGDVSVQERLAIQELRENVAAAIDQSRQFSRTEPELSLNIVQEAAGTVEGNPIVSRTIKRELLELLAREREDLRNIIRQNELREQARVQRIAAIKAEERLIDEFVQEEQQIEQLTDKVRALILEGRHGSPQAFEDAEEVAEVIVDMRPTSGVGAAAFFTAEASGQLDKAYRLRSLRADRFLETLYQVELSHVPFPDEPPILWPDAATWRELTERRQKWAAVDLRESSPAEQKIEQSLQLAINDLPLNNNPLEDIISELAQQYEIPIIFDRTNLAADNIDTTQPVPITQRLSGISLRSALRIILDPLQLTYVIKDEVMWITTKLAADDLDQYGSTRVYPVGDLVVPITPPQVGGLGQGFGGVGGIGGGGLGGGGQFGAGGQGFGGGGGLGGGGLGGGGFGGGGAFSVPPQQIPRPQLRNRLRQAPANGPIGPQLRDGEVQNLLDDILGAQPVNEQSSVTPIRFQAFAQVKDPFRLDNSSLDRKKKAVTNR